MKLAELQELESRWVMQTYARAPVELVRGEGARVWDSDGKEYLDFLAGSRSAPSATVIPRSSRRCASRSARSPTPPTCT